ncbi:VWA domain-containing protein [Clostridium ganghwense]|uniref:VWA domain-containing protein n=1 Tax=Clostridium ganghwense TaxID=312089 RepID=A0ABT4CS55_9CLOT|nr:VWA domain-containing protein [Clostridium ganghwense]MCY6370906.1 VWA domain-containing protein [Clostridium ganghwense]
MRKKIFNFILVFVFMLNQISILPAFAAETNSEGDKVVINRTVNGRNLEVGDTFTVDYTITPKELTINQQSNKNKDIVLVIDTSGSMDWGVNGAENVSYNKKRLSIMKNVAKGFVEKFKGNDKVRIGLVKYDNLADVVFDLDYVNENDDENLTNSNINRICNELNINKNNVYCDSSYSRFYIYKNGQFVRVYKKSDLEKEFRINVGIKTKIDELSAHGSTNIGDGLRRAYYRLNNNDGHEKFIIMMTDGQPEAYSVGYKMGYGKASGYYQTTWRNNGTIINDYREEALIYSKKIATEKIKDSDIKTFVVGFGNGTDDSKNLEIANSAGGVYKNAQSESDIQSVYDEIQKIIETNVSASAHFEETIDELQVMNSEELPQGLRVEENKIVGDIKNIYYTKNSNGKYEAKPIEFSVTYKANRVGTYTLGLNETSFVKYNVNNSLETVPLSSESINVSNKQIISDDLVQIQRTINDNSLSLGETFLANYRIIPQSISVDYDNIFGEYRGKLYKKFRKNNGKIQMKQYWFGDKNNFTPIDDKLYEIVAHGNYKNLTQEEKKELQEGKIIQVGNHYYREITASVNEKFKNSLTADAHFEESFTQGLEVVNAENLPQGLRVEGNKIVGDIPVYYSKGGDKFNADEISFNITYKTKKNNSYKLGANDESFVEYTLGEEYDGQEKEYFSEAQISLEQSSNKPKVTIKVSDALGVKDTFKVESQNSGTEREDKFLETDNLLKGQGYAEFQAEDVNLDSFKYKFVKSNVQPQNLPTQGWTDVKVNNDGNSNTDIMKDKSGYLKWRSYDVSHMPNLSGRDKWSNRSETFKKPSNIIQIQSTAVSDANSYIDHINGKWLANTVFMRNFFVDNNYKESSKFWGYIKPDEDGDYYFGINSDDGSYGYIIVDGEQIDIVNKNSFFVPQGSKFGTLNNVMRLKKDKYYPIYLEYFNWGGSAHFQLWYNNVNKITNRNKNNVPYNWFYPAKNNTPGEYPEATFKVNYGVQFPEQPGKYYIAYKAENSDGGYREGFYGPFVVGGKAPITLSRKIVGDSAIRVADEFNIEYTVKPEDIKIQEKYGESIIKNIQYEEILPQGIEIVEKNGVNGFEVAGQNVKKNLGNITYRRNDEKGVYEAQPITFTVRFKGNEVKEFNLGVNEKATVNYEDLDGANRQKEFSRFTIGVTKKLTPDVVVTRKIANDKTSVMESRNFEIVYTITPQPITSQEISKAFGDQSVEDRLVVTNVKFTETFPDVNKFNVLKVEGLQNVDLTNSGVVVGNVSNITYTKQSDGSYTAQPFEVRVKLNVSEKGTYTLGSNKASYLEYTAFDGDKIKNPFIDMELVVNPFEAQLQLARTILADDDNFKRGETFKSKYTITPLELSLSDYFDDNQIALIQSQGENAIDKNGNKLFDNFVINNIKFQENVSTGLSVISNSKFTFTNGTVTGNIPNITYRLNKNKDKLVADPVSFEVQFRCVSAGRYVLGEHEGSFITYNDYNGEQGKKIFNMTSLEFEDINVEEISGLLIRTSLVSNSSDHNKYDLNVDVTEAVVNGEKISLKQLKVKNTADAEYNIYDPNVTAVDGIKTFIKSGLDENFLTGKYITIVGTDEANKSVTITVPIIKLVTNEFVEGENNIVIESQPDIWVDEFEANGTEYITETTHPKTNSSSGVYRQNNVKLIAGSSILEVEVRNSDGNISRRIFDISTAKTNVVKQGIFVKDDRANKYIIGGNESEESNVKVNNINIIRTMVQHIGVMIEVNNNKSKFEIDVDARYNTRNTKFNIYELNNGTLNRTPVFTSICKLNEISNELLKYQFENGKTYIIEYTFITDAPQNIQIVNKVKIDNVEVAKLKILVEKLPKLD